MRTIYITLIVVLFAIIMIFGDYRNRVLAGVGCVEHVHVMCDYYSGRCITPETASYCDDL